MSSQIATRHQLMRLKQALFSVSNKDRILEFAGFLLKDNIHLKKFNSWNIVATGKTYDHLTSVTYGEDNRNAKKRLYNRITPISELTGASEMLEGRVKSLHPSIFAALLARKDQDVELKQYNIDPIDIVACNLYPFIENPSIENIDIGGVALIRAAAKNFERVTILTDPSDYEECINLMKKHDGEIPLNYRKEMASLAFKRTCMYDAAIAEHFNQGDFKVRAYHKIQPLKYGCNPHQKDAAVWKLISSYSSLVNYRIASSNPPFMELIHGNPSYINYLDAFNGWGLVNELKHATKQPAAASFKHTSPAGAATFSHTSHSPQLTREERIAYFIEPDRVLSPLQTAFIRARNGDPRSSFGDFIACSDKIDVDTALLINREMSDGIIAPDYDQEALSILKKKKKGNFIVMKGHTTSNAKEEEEFRELPGGCGLVLSQQPNLAETFNVGVMYDCFNNSAPNLGSGNYLKKFLETNMLGEGLDYLVANICVKYAQSNSVAIAKNAMLIGMGSGQQSRLGCIQIAGEKSRIWHARLKLTDDLLRMKNPDLPRHLMTRQDRINHIYKLIEEMPAESKVVQMSGSLASDGFIPFVDNIETAAKYGITHIIQPGGSIADEEVQKACDEYRINMIRTGVRFFTH